MNQAKQHTTQRDSSSLRVLGIFFTILGTTVLVATFWELEQPRAAIVNLVSGLILVGVGAGSWMISTRLNAQQK